MCTGIYSNYLATLTIKIDSLGAIFGHWTKSKALDNKAATKMPKNGANSVARLQLGP